MLRKIIKWKVFVKNENGFSLIELMVVVAIIGILAVAIIPQFGGAEDTAKIGVAKSDLKNFQTALHVLKARNGSFPLTAGTPWQDLRAGKLLLGDAASNTAPNDPWGRAYTYTGTATTFSIKSNGPDGTAGNGDDLTVSEASGP